MPDPDRVREAIVNGDWDVVESDAVLPWRDLVVLMGAARLWLEGTEIRWCEEHDMPEQDGWSVCAESMWTGRKSTCRFVSRRLVGGE